MGDLERYLQLLVTGKPEGRYLELRYRRAVGMGQRFLPAVDVDGAARLARRLGQASDTYVGVALRDRPAGGRNAVAESRVLFVEIDAAAAQRLLRRAPAPPSMTVQSGTPHHLHAYWLLSRAVSGPEVKAANRKLCHRVGGDPASVDESRILRPPETLSFKHHPPRPVLLQSLHEGCVYELRELMRELEEPPGRDTNVSRHAAVAVARPSAPDPDGVHARLRAIPTAEYVQRLTGLQPNPEGKVSCPWHEDRTPSLQLYPDGEWCCFGCRRGGTIYDFAGALFQMQTKGRAFLELRARLARELGVVPVPTPWRAARRAQRPAPRGAIAAADRDRLTTLSTVRERGGR